MLFSMVAIGSTGDVRPYILLGQAQCRIAWICSQ